MAKRYLILPSQKNQVLEAVLHEGMNPAEFEWLEVLEDAESPFEGVVSLLIHTPTESEFEFDMRSQTMLALFAPGANRPRHAQQVDDWDGMYSQVQSWLQALRNEYECPDMWAEFAEAVATSERAETPESEAVEDDELSHVHPVAMAHFKNWEKRQSEAKRRRAATKKEFLFRVQGF